jgi:hypothetical protein
MVASMLATTNDRIFTQGKDANGASLGSYSKGYLKTRLKENRSGTKVELQLTGQMENDFSVINTGKEIGLGFKNVSGDDDNPGAYEKSVFVEATYKKPIFQATDEEVKLALEIFEKNIKEILNG